MPSVSRHFLVGFSKRDVGVVRPPQTRPHRREIIVRFCRSGCVGKRRHRRGIPGDGEDGSSGGVFRHSKARTDGAVVGQKGPVDGSVGSTGDGCHHPHARMGSFRSSQ